MKEGKTLAMHQTRLLHVLSAIGEKYGGPSVSVPALCDAIQKKGRMSVTFISQSPDADITTSEVEGVKNIIFSPLRFTEQFPSLTFAFRLWREVGSSSFVNIHGCWSPTASLAMLFSILRRRPFVLFPLGMLRKVAMKRKPFQKWLYLRLFDIHMFRRASAFALFHPDERAEVQDLLGCGTRCIQVANGMDWERFDEELRSARARDLLAKPRGTRIVTIGRLHWSKGLNLLAEAFSLVLREIPDCEWILIGHDGGEWENLKLLNRSLGTEGKVTWLGGVKHAECIRLASECDLFVMTSRHEGHSVALNEAVGLGLPIVVTKGASIPALEGMARVSVPEATVAAIAAAIVEMLRLNTIEGPLNAESIADRRRRLEWPNALSELFELYHSIDGTGISE